MTIRLAGAHLQSSALRIKKEKKYGSGLHTFSLFLLSRDDDGTRTHTFFRTPAPQAGKSTNFSTSPENKKPGNARLL
jgi:hypothetical protein